jgi:sarcosine oxidase subunit gamma
MSSNPATVSAETPLRYFHRLSSHQTHSAELFNGDADFGLVIKEAPLCTHLNLRGSAQDQSFVAAIEAVLGIAVPVEPGSYHANQQHSIYWLGPDEWLLVSQTAAAELEAALRQALSGHIAIVDISGAQTLINLRGTASAVQTVLKKSSVYDFGAWSLAEKGAGRCAQTTFAKAGAVVSNRSDGSFDLIVRRSFADYIARWLLDAGQEFGCRIEG